jgi:sulfhydrogenase subunit alpha
MREILVEPLARVEGDGGITIRIEGDKIKQVDFDILEGTRLVETLVVGKTPEEDVSIACRICAICTLSHRYAALRALEKALGIKVPPKTQWTRTLMHLGEFLESNSLHVFLLALPDFLGYPSAVAMLDKHADDVVKGLALKKYGNKIMKVTSGRMIHGENPTIGGFGKYPDRQTLLDLKNEAAELMPAAERAVAIVAGFDVPSYFEKETVFMCCEPGDNAYGIVGDLIKISDGKTVPVEEYRSLTNEKFSPHSAAKHCLYNGKPYTVGGIARMNNLGERLKGKSLKLFEKHWNKRWLKNPVYNNLAQAIELVWCLEQIPRIVDNILSIVEDPILVKPTRTKGEGVGAVEAPRGTLYHNYKIEDGLVAEANLIIPTGQSLEDIEKYMRIAVEELLKQKADDRTIRMQCEIIARSYDPCISCSTHMVTIERT